MHKYNKCRCGNIKVESSKRCSACHRSNKAHSKSGWWRN